MAESRRSNTAFVLGGLLVAALAWIAGFWSIVECGDPSRKSQEGARAFAVGSSSGNSPCRIRRKGTGGRDPQPDGGGAARQISTITRQRKELETVALQHGGRFRSGHG